MSPILLLSILFSYRQLMGMSNYLFFALGTAYMLRCGGIIIATYLNTICMYVSIPVYLYF